VAKRNFAAAAKKGGYQKNFTEHLNQRTKKDSETKPVSSPVSITGKGKENTLRREKVYSRAGRARNNNKWR